jgi:hypothetical protein
MVDIFLVIDLVDNFFDNEEPIAEEPPLERYIEPWRAG